MVAGYRVDYKVDCRRAGIDRWGDEWGYCCKEGAD